MSPNAGTNLLIFSKYPTAGKAKTRLIPAVGAKTAAELHRRMVESIIDVARDCTADKSNQINKVTVHHTGAAEKNFRCWLGSDLNYQEQPDGDLGQRMSTAFKQTFSQGFDHAIGVGTDVPSLSVALLCQAEENLKDHDLVLGPAVDGGYYLIGMNKPHAELFSGIDWGTPQVLHQTQKIASHLNLKIATLATLSDVDLAVDLVPLKNDPRFCDVLNNTPLLSVIIPTLNEAATIKATITNLHKVSGIEIIVADGGSSDGTVEIASKAGVIVIETTGGRAAQLNCGAQSSKGRYLLFLHADTAVPNDYNKLIFSALANPAIVAGAFRFKTDQTSFAMKIIEWGTNLRSTRCQLPYGDQGLFMEKRLFIETGGFPAMQIMEDFALVQKLRKRGTIVTLTATAVTAARRWKKGGIIRTTMINQVMIIGFYLGVPTEILRRIYRGKVNLPPQ